MRQSSRCSMVLVINAVILLTGCGGASLQVVATPINTFTPIAPLAVSPMATSVDTPIALPAVVPTATSVDTPIAPPMVTPTATSVDTPIAPPVAGAPFNGTPGNILTVGARLGVPPTPTSVDTPIAPPVVSPTAASLDTPIAPPPPAVSPTATSVDTPIAPPPLPTSSIILGYHVVKPSETLYCIGRAYQVSPQAIALVNRISSGALSIGQRLAIPDVPWTDIPAGPVCARQW